MNTWGSECFISAAAAGLNFCPLLPFDIDFFPFFFLFSVSQTAPFLWKLLLKWALLLPPTSLINLLWHLTPLKPLNITAFQLFFFCFFFFFTKNVTFRSALQGCAQGLFCTKDKIKWNIKRGFWTTATLKQQPHCNVSYDASNITLSPTSVEAYPAVTPLPSLPTSADFHTHIHNSSRSRQGKLKHTISTVTGNKSVAGWDQQFLLSLGGGICA